MGHLVLIFVAYASSSAVKKVRVSLPCRGRLVCHGLSVGASGVSAFCDFRIVTIL